MAINSSEVTRAIAEQAKDFINHYRNSSIIKFYGTNAYPPGNLSTFDKSHTEHLDSRRSDKAEGIKVLAHCSRQILKHKLEVTFKDEKGTELDIDVDRLTKKLGISDNTIITPILMELLVKATMSTPYQTIELISDKITKYLDIIDDAKEKIAGLSMDQKRLLAKHIKYDDSHEDYESLSNAITKVLNNEEPNRPVKDSYSRVRNVI